MTGRFGPPGAERVSARNALSTNLMEATARPMTLLPEPDFVTVSSFCTRFSL